MSRIDAWMAQQTPETLRARGSMKWTAAGPDEIGAFIAESDLPLAPAVVRAVQDALAGAHTGYLGPVLARSVAQACAQFERTRFGWDVDPDRILVVPDVFGALQLTSRLLAPGRPVVIPTPAYMPFLLLAQVTGAQVRTVPMEQVGDRWLLDPDRLASALESGGLLVLVNPHNPTGQVSTRAELEQIADVVQRTGSAVFVDEIHAPVIHPGAEHVPYATVSETAAEHSVTAVSASKGWNLPGLPCAQLILTGEAHRRAAAAWNPVVLHGATPLGAIASATAYAEGVEHLDACNDYLDRGRRLFADGLAAALPQVGHRAPQATYLQWLDLRPMGVDPASVRQRTGVYGTDGTECGTPGFLRLTLGTSHAVVAEVVDRLSGLAHA